MVVVICKFGDVVRDVHCCTAVRQQNEQQWTKHIALGGSCVKKLYPIQTVKSRIQLQTEGFRCSRVSFLIINVMNAELKSMIIILTCLFFLSR